MNQASNEASNEAGNETRNDGTNDGTATSLQSRIWRALKPDAQAFDEVRIRTVPRFKQSGLSGDEWRISAVLELFRKGKKIHERTFRNVEIACAYAAASYYDAIDNGLGMFGGENDICDQEGCSAPAIVTYRLKARYCDDGHKSEPDYVAIRKFCERHKTRGDSALDDSDDNYELFEPSESKP